MREDIALALDGSAILLVAIGLWLAFARRSWLGASLGAVGLAAMASLTILRAYPNPTRAEFQESVKKLQGDVSAAIEKWRQSEAKAVSLSEKLRSAAEVAATKEKELKEQVGRAESETKNARSHTAAILGKLMVARLSTDFYRIQTLGERELVHGKTGCYYSAKLKNGKGELLVFARGRFSLPAAGEEDIDTALEHLIAEVIYPISRTTRYEVFVRGGADAEPVADGQDVPGAYASIAYRPLGFSGKYEAKLPGQPVSAPLRNEDLPVLRAEYYRKVIRRRFPDREIDVLHSLPSRDLTEEARTVELVLYFETCGAG